MFGFSLSNGKTRYLLNFTSIYTFQFLVLLFLNVNFLVPEDIKPRCFKRIYLHLLWSPKTLTFFREFLFLFLSYLQSTLCRKIYNKSSEEELPFCEEFWKWL